MLNTVKFWLTLQIIVENIVREAEIDISFSFNVAGFSPEIFEGVVAFSGVVKLGSITNVTQSTT